VSIKDLLEKKIVKNPKFWPL